RNTRHKLGNRKPRFRSRERERSMLPNERPRESVPTRGPAVGIPGPTAERPRTEPDKLEKPIDVKAAAEFLGVSASLVYAYVERKQIPHFRMMGRAIRF